MVGSRAVIELWGIDTLQSLNGICDVSMIVFSIVIGPYEVFWGFKLVLFISLLLFLGKAVLPCWITR